jgi:hypothetical protein
LSLLASLSLLSVIDQAKENRHLSRSGSQPHRESRRGTIPAFAFFERSNSSHQDPAQAPNAVKKIITNPNPKSPSASNNLHPTLYHRFPATDQESWIANQNAATAIAPNSNT